MSSKYVQACSLCVSETLLCLEVPRQTFFCLTVSRQTLSETLFETLSETLSEMGPWP